MEHHDILVGEEHRIGVVGKGNLSGGKEIRRQQQQQQQQLLGIVHVAAAVASASKRAVVGFVVRPMLRPCQEEEAAKDGMAEETAGKEIERDGKGWPQTLVLPDRFHGKNPNGVGVSPLLSLAPARAFSSLQSETEEKVKWYGCVCWSSVPIASNEELLQKLGCMPWDKEGAEDDAAAAIDSCIYPLEIQQSTPLRVMHRRSSDVRPKYILSLSACRIDDHWFRLRMSKSAGTYVKEFVHGDCGRTHPSIGSMLGGRTDITELDCEGIAV